MIDRMSRETWVYFARHGAAIKIGLATDVKRRVAQLQTACSGELRLIGAIRGTREDEAALHASLARERMRGEWFRASHDVVTLLEWILSRCVLAERIAGELDRIRDLEVALASAKQERDDMRAAIHRLAGYEIRYFDEWPVKPGTALRADGKAKADAYMRDRGRDLRDYWRPDGEMLDVPAPRQGGAPNPERQGA